MNLLPFEKDEKVSAVIATKDFPEDEYLMFATAGGMVKKTAMKLYDRTRRDGLIAISLKDGDELISVQRVATGEKVMMVSSAGKAIQWDEEEVRAMGRDTQGVRGMNCLLYTSDHSTIMHSFDLIEKGLNEDRNLREEIEAIRRMLRSKEY